ncbi:hypothetical protein Cgig2_010025 [Carnegiea gigantea]|uniref:Uncharacterized protein n=1 Tax=Carnegiea gigantea TaxID=171969 RepID=A0A9Q1K3R7_9CARY|nr:hypothetical protein Cgig2_010025 [Carnegiea gigantea]
MVRSCSPTVHRRSLLITQAIVNSCRWVKLHQPRVLTLGLKISFYTEGLRCQVDHSASASALEWASSSWCCKSFFLASKASFSLFSFSKTLKVANPLLEGRNRRPRSHHLQCSGKGLEKTQHVQLRKDNNKQHKQHRLSLTLAMTICSSSTADGPAGSDGANDHDLANLSTKVHLAEELATKNSTAGARVLTEGSPMTCGTAWRSLRDPPAARDPIPRQRWSSLQIADAGHAPDPFSPGPQRCGSRCRNHHPQPAITCGNLNEEGSVTRQEASCHVVPTMALVGRKNQ